VPLTADRVKESSASTGLGPLTLGGAATGFRSFESAFGLGVEFWYAVSSAGGAEWEVGIGSLSATATLVRGSVLASSSGGAAVAFSAGPKDVFATIPASALNSLAAAGTTLYASLALTATAAGKRQALGATTEVRFTAASAGAVRVRFTDASAAIGVGPADTLVDCAAATPVRLAVPSGQPFLEFVRGGAADVNFSLGLMR
jgi:hypothetical protein